MAAPITTELAVENLIDAGLDARAAGVLHEALARMFEALADAEHDEAGDR